MHEICPHENPLSAALLCTIGADIVDEPLTLQGANFQSIGGDVSVIAVEYLLLRHSENFDLGGLQFRGHVCWYDFMSCSQCRQHA